MLQFFWQRGHKNLWSIEGLYRRLLYPVGLMVCNMDIYLHSCLSVRYLWKLLKTTSLKWFSKGRKRATSNRIQDGGFVRFCPNLLVELMVWPTHTCCMGIQVIVYTLCRWLFASDDLFCYSSCHRWWRHFHTCYIISANNGQVGFFCCWGGHFTVALKVFQKLFRLIECQIRPHINVSDFEFDEELSHLVWHECSKHFLADHADGCVCRKFIFDFGVWNAQHIHDQFCVSYTIKKRDLHEFIFKEQMEWICFDEREYLRLASCCGSPKTLFFCWPNHQQTNWLLLKKECRRFTIAFVFANVEKVELIFV